MALIAKLRRIWRRIYRRAEDRGTENQYPAGSRNPDHYVKTKTVSVTLILVSPFVFLVGVFLTMALLGAPRSALLAFFGSLATVPVFVMRKRLWLVRVAIILILLLLIVLPAKLADDCILVRELQSRLDLLSRKLDSTPPLSFSMRDKLAVYGFGLLMVAGGAVQYPEVAREHLMLYVPGPATRRWESSFAMEARPVQKALERFAEELDDLDPAVATAPLTAPLIWFEYKKHPYRVALALNPLKLRAQASRSGDDWLIRVVGSVPVRYPSESRISIPVPGDGNLVVPEGLFWMLQESGWLHPYTAEWAWVVRASTLR